MTVEVAKVGRGNISSYLSVVGNLIGEATVEVAPKTGGRLVSMNVKLGDRVRRGQVLAKVDDREIVEQVRQAEASHQVAEATIRQREADLSLALTSVERSRNLYGRQLLPKQTLDDAEARYTAAVAQLDLSRAQMAQSAARLEELKINLANTNVVSPVDGFVGKRNVDPGAWVSQNAGVASIVDISRLRLVANVVEKDLRLVNTGDPAMIEVDAYPGREVQGPDRARVAGAGSEHAHRHDGSGDSQSVVPAEAGDVREGQPRGRDAREGAADTEGRARRLRRPARRLSGERGQPRAVQGGQSRPRGHRTTPRSSRASPRAKRSSPQAPARCDGTTSSRLPVRQVKVARAVAAALKAAAAAEAWEAARAPARPDSQAKAGHAPTAARHRPVVSRRPAGRQASRSGSSRQQIKAADSR